MILLRSLAGALIALALVASPVSAQQKGGKGAKGATKGGEAVEAPAELPPWIDTHVHLRIGQGVANIAPALANAARLTANARLATFIVMPQPATEPGSRAYDYDDFVGQLAGLGGRVAFLGGNRLNQMIAATSDGKVSAAQTAEFAREAERVLAARAAGFGEISITHISRFAGHPFQNVPGDHPLLLLLADIAGRAGKPIDIHMDVYDHDAAPPPPMRAGNPAILPRNTDGLERLLAHNRAARIMLAHFGSDITGQWSTELTRRLLRAHPNLYMSIKVYPPAGNAALRDGTVPPAWIELIGEFPDRFVIGTDSFFAPPAAPATAYEPAPVYRFLMGLPPDLRTKVASANAARLYGLPPP